MGGSGTVAPTLNGRKLFQIIPDFSADGWLAGMYNYPQVSVKYHWSYMPVRVYVIFFTDKAASIDWSNRT